MTDGDGQMPILTNADVAEVLTGVQNWVEEMAESYAGLTDEQIEVELETFPAQLALFNLGRRLFPDAFERGYNV